MSEPSTSNPDTGNTTSVTPDAAAAMRENPVSTRPAEPLPVRAILLCAAVVLVAGYILGNSLFDYSNYVKPGYTRPVSATAAPLKPEAALDAFNKIGKKGYAACTACHQADGMGNASFPPLANSEWVNGPVLRPAMIILNGLHGPITVNGKTYDNNMPTMGAGMDAKQLAGVLNYIRNNFGNKSDQLISVEMAQKAIDISKERNGGQMTAGELNEKYNKDLEGTPIAPDTPVNPKTLLPAS